MSLLNELFEKFNIIENSFKLYESSKVLQSNLKIDGKNSFSIEELLDLINKFPKRDDLTISITNVFDNSIKITNKEVIDKDMLEKFLIDSEDDDEIDVLIKIEKEILNNKLSIYNFEEFTKDILKKDTLENMKMFSYLLEDLDFLIFELYDSNILFSTKTLLFKNYLQSDVELKFNRMNKLNICNKASSFYNTTNYKLIPDDFKVEYDYVGNPLREIFEKIQTLLSLIYISNNSVIEDKKLKIEILGQRKIESTIDIPKDVIVNKELYNIYSWIYTDGNVIDKSIIARNIISLHCRFSNIQDLDKKTMASIQSNFELYQKNNVDKYIELKNKLADYIFNILSEVSDKVLGLSNNLIKNLMVFVTFLFSVVVANIVSDSPITDIFTKDILKILNLFLGGSILYLLYSIYEVLFRLNNLKKIYEGIENNYVDLLEQQDISNIFNDDIYKKNAKSAYIKIGVITSIWFLIVLLCYITFNSINMREAIINLFREL